jgi:hypothetical protein
MKTVMEMAKQASKEWTKELRDCETAGQRPNRFFEIFAKLVAEQEREACEKLRNHDDVLAPVGNSAYSEWYQDGWIAGTQAYHEAIRARGQK